MGSCGVGFAPVRDDDHEKLISLMEGVEDIPGSALAEGIKWGWRTFAEYIDVLSKTPRLIDIGTQVPHDALRVFVMRDRAVAQEPATEADIAAMRAELRHGLDSGAFGFSTGRTDNHRAIDGSATPASESAARELIGIAEAFQGLEHGVVQAVSDFDMAVSANRFDGEFDILEEMARAAGRPLSISVMQRTGDSEQWRKILKRIEQANEKGLVIRGQVAPRAIGVLLGFEATFHPFMGFPSYKAVAHLPLADRVRHLSNPEVKARLLGEKSEKVAGDGSPIPPLADQLLANLDFVTMSLFRLGAKPNYEPSREQSLFGEAMRSGKKPLEVVLDAMLEDDGRSLLYFPIYNYASASLDEVGEMLHHPLTLMGLADGGAHVGTICDASFPTFLLSHWARDREKARFCIERAVQMLTSDTAKFVGLNDRGVIAVGKKADLNVIELDKLSLSRPALVRDLPAGGRRLLQAVEGYLATIVSGEVTRRGGEATAARPGRIVRAGR
jgi:N-acyl-D-aspartate/D-glutamate deacylase